MTDKIKKLSPTCKAVVVCGGGKKWPKTVKVTCQICGFSEWVRKGCEILCEGNQ